MQQSMLCLLLRLIDLLFIIVHAKQKWVMTNCKFHWLINKACVTTDFPSPGANNDSMVAKSCYGNLKYKKGQKKTDGLI
jgi:hypothetical protein